MGSSQILPNQTECLQCSEGFYGSKEGSKECKKCPYPLSSSRGNNTCSFCSSGFYLTNLTASQEEIFRDSLTYCKPCPEKGICNVNTTIATLGIRKNYWRLSNMTATIYRCNSEACIGSSEGAISTSSGINFDEIYCKENHTGPLCESCILQNSYFDKDKGECKSCPSSAIMTATLTIFLFAVCIIAGIIYYLSKKFLHGMISSISFQAKLKLMLSFYQIFSSLEDVYGVKISRNVTAWASELLAFLSLDVIKLLNQLVVPESCLFNTKRSIIIRGTMPYMIIILAILFLIAYIAYRRCYHTKDTDNFDIEETLKKRIIQLTIIILYFSLPSACRGIFDGIKCRPFDNNDFELGSDSSKSYLLIDFSINCGSEYHKSIVILFVVFFTIWAILTPVAFLVLLMKIRSSVLSGSITFLADASRFLWLDYKPFMLYWDGEYGRTCIISCLHNAHISNDFCVHVHSH